MELLYYQKLLHEATQLLYYLPLYLPHYRLPTHTSLSRIIMQDLSVFSPPLRTTNNPPDLSNLVECKSTNL